MLNIRDLKIDNTHSVSHREAIRSGTAEKHRPSQPFRSCTGTKIQMQRQTESQNYHLRIHLPGHPSEGLEGQAGSH